MNIVRALLRRSPANPPGRESNWPRALFTIAALSVSLYFLIHATPEMLRWSSHYPWDGFIDWGGAKEMLAGHDPYSEPSLKAIGLTKDHGLSHPPTTLVWFYPLAHFNAMTMKHVFTLITLLLLIYHAGIVTRELRFPLWPLVTLVVFSAVYQTDWFILHIDQVDLSELIAFLYVMCWYFLRRGRDVEAGVMAGLACTLKLYPAILVVFLMLSRRWRAVVAAGLAYLAFAVEVTRQLGPACFKHFLEQTGSYANNWIASIRNASIDGIVHRWFYPIWGVFPGGRPVLLRASLIAAVIAAALLGLAWLVSAPSLRQARRNPVAIDMPFALFSILSMTPGPYQWEHYGVTLILPFLVLAADALYGEGEGWRHRAGGGARKWTKDTVFRAIVLVGVLPAVALMLNVDYWRRVEVAKGQPVWSFELSFYEYTTWLPWFFLSLAIGIRMLLLNLGRRTNAALPASNTTGGSPTAAGTGPNTMVSLASEGST